MYKSQGRDQFEQAQQSLTLSSETPYQVVKCRKQGSLESWFKQEFPQRNYELVLGSLDFEIWKAESSPYIEIIALQKVDKGTHSCTYHFLNETTWQKYQEQFIQEVETHFLMAE